MFFTVFNHILFLGGKDMFCRKCGNEVEDGAQFCASCGSPVLGANTPDYKTSQAQPRETIVTSDVTGNSNTGNDQNNNKKVLTIGIIAGAVVLCLIIVCIIIATGKKEDSGKTADADTAMEETEAEETVTEEKPEKEETDETNSVEPEENEPEYDEFDISGIVTPYSNGCAWVKYMVDGVEHTGLIDAEGKVLFDLDKRGYVFNEGGSVYARNDDGCVILDADGNETVRFTNTDENTFAVIGAYNGKYLMGEKIETFSDNKSIMYIIDQNGNKITEDIEVTDLPNGLEMKMFRKGIYYGTFFLGHEVNGGTEGCPKVLLVFNLLNSTCFSVELDEDIYGDDFKSYFDWGNYVLEDTDGYAVFYQGHEELISPEDYTDKEKFENFLLGHKEYIDEFLNEYNSENYDPWKYSFYAFPVREGLQPKWGTEIYSGGHDNEYAVFDREGKIVFEGQFPEGTTVIHIYPYSGGIAIIALRGYDGNDYVTAIDTKGNLLYEPKKTSEDLYYAYWDQSKGYFIIEEGILTPSGDVLSWDDDLTMIPADVRLIKGRNGNTMLDAGIFEGYVVSPGSNEIRSIDGNTSFDKVKIAK